LNKSIEGEEHKILEEERHLGSRRLGAAPQPLIPEPDVIASARPDALRLRAFASGRPFVPSGVDSLIRACSRRDEPGAPAPIARSCSGSPV